MQFLLYNLMHFAIQESNVEVGPLLQLQIKNNLMQLRPTANVPMYEDT
jgi:hypothetical protein